MNFRVGQRGHVESPRTALASRAKQAGWLPRGQAEAHGAANAPAVGVPAAAAAAAAGAGGRRTVDPGRRGGKKDRASARARGSGTARRDATRRADSWQHGRARDAATPQRDSHGRQAILPTLMGVRRTADRRRKESRFAVLEEMKRDEARTSARATDKDGRTRVATARVEREGQGGQTRGAREKESGLERKILRARSTGFPPDLLRFQESVWCIRNTYICLDRTVFIYPTHFSSPETRPLCFEITLISFTYQVARNVSASASCVIHFYATNRLSARSKNVESRRPNPIQRILLLGSTTGVVGL